MNKLYYKNFLVLLLFLLCSNFIFSQVNYNDGPIRLRVWAYKFWSSANCGEIGNQEYSIKDIRARVSNTTGGYTTSPGGFNVFFDGNENRYWDCSSLLSTDNPPSACGANGYQLLDVSYGLGTTQAPSQFEVYIGSAFENDCEGDVLSCGDGNRKTYEGCCCLFGVCALADDYLYTGIGWNAVNFRAGAEGMVNYTQPVIYNYGSEHSYSIIYAYQWDWLANEKPLCSNPAEKYTDGPITLNVDLTGVFSDMDWDGGTCGLSVFGDEDLRIKILARGNILDPAFGNFPTGLGSAIKVNQNIPKWNAIGPTNVLTKNYTNANFNMESYDLAWDLWEEDGYSLPFGLGQCGTDDNYEDNAYVFPWNCPNVDDDHAVNRVGGPGGAVGGTPLTRVNWRDSPPNTWNTIDVPVRIGTSNYQNWILRFRYRWTIASPTVSIPTSDLQACTPAALTLTATTTNATYYQWQVADQNGSGAGSCPGAANWSNVAGANCRQIIFPTTLGTRTYRLVVYNRNGSGSTTSGGPKFDSAVSNCVRVTYFPYAPPIISTACGRSVPSGSAIAFTVPSVPALNAIGDALPGWQYNWSISPATNVAPATATNSTTFNPTFTAAAAGTTYTVTLTVVDPCGVADATSTCTFNVTTPSCDMIYVSATSGNDAWAGTATAPYATIQNAINNVSGSRNHIRVESGTYNNEIQWLMPSNAIVDGGWEIVSLANGDWRKSSTLSTIVNMNPGQENDGTQGFYRGIRSNGNNWMIQDMWIYVKTGAYQPAFNSQFNNRGFTIYGVYSNNTTGWSLKRVFLQTGQGTNGANGTTTSGTGSAGGGGTGGTGNGQGSVQDNYGNSTNGDAGTAGATNGGGGAAGTAGAGGNRQTGTGTNLVGCDANPANGSPGNPGGDGGNGQGANGGNPTIRPATPGVASPFYQPAGQALSGLNGAGGGGGGKGGGGDNGTCCTCSCGNDARPNGGNGGNGGGGGVGGTGGFGAGGSFGIYSVVGGTNTLNQMWGGTVYPGGGGTGGTGANGQAGTDPGNNGAGGVCATGCDGGCGGSGGRGGIGGTGGRGQDGANGLSQAIVNIASTLNNNGGSPDRPNAVADFLRARYNKGCTNSFIELQKATGSSPPSPAFNLAAAGAALVNDQSPNTSTYTNPTGAITTQVYFTSIVPNFKTLGLTSGGNVWTDFIRIIEARPLPTFTLSKKRICSGETSSITITSNNPNQDYTPGNADYEYRTRIYKDGTVRRSPVPAWSVTSTGAGPNTLSGFTNATCDSITYLVAVRVKDKCCGWSIWVYDSIVVFPAITPPTAWSGTSPANGSNICITSATVLNPGTPTGQSGGICAASNLLYRYSTDGGVNWTAWSSTNPNPITKVIGTTIVQSAYISTKSPDNCDTVYSSSDITWTINEAVTATAGVVDVASCGTPDITATISAASPAIGSGSWTQVSGASSSTPATPTSALSLTISGIPFGTIDNIYKWTVTNGACTDNVNVTITTPTVVTNQITVQSDACYTCTILNGATYDYYDFAGKAIMKIQDINVPIAELGSTEVCTHIDGFVPTTVTNHYGDLMPYLQRYWTISPVTGTNSTVTLYFLKTEYDALKAAANGTPYAFSSISELRVSKFPGGGAGVFAGPQVPGGENIVTGGFGGLHPAWVGPVYASWAGNGTDYQVTFTIDSYSTFFIHPVREVYEVLPVELVSFTGTNIGDRNRLDWVTATEINTQKFVVEKSVDALNWVYLGERPAAGNSNIMRSYELFDNLPVVGTNYYRLKIIDLDGTFKYSNIVIIKNKDFVSSGIIGAYPNPTTGDITILISSSSDYKSSVKVIDILGKIVQSFEINISSGINMPTFNFSALSAAPYIISINDDTGKENRLKFIKQ